MAGYHHPSSSSGNGGSSSSNNRNEYYNNDEYVDFNKFVSQHNMRQMQQQQYYGNANLSIMDRDGGRLTNRDSTIFNGIGSNLMPTASEFVPMQQSYGGGGGENVSFFDFGNFLSTGQNFGNDGGNYQQQNYNQLSSANMFAPPSSINLPSSQMWNYNEPPQQSANDSDRLLAAIQNTSINDKNTGTVKKSHYQNGNGTGAKDGNRWTNKTGNGGNAGNRNGGYRRGGGTGRTASQYDDMCYNKHFSNEMNDRTNDREKSNYDHHQNNHHRNNNQNNNHYHHQQQHRYDDRNNAGTTSSKSYNGGTSSSSSSKSYNATRDDKQSSSRSSNTNNNAAKHHHPDYKPNRNLEFNSKFDSTSAECSQREKLIREIDAGKLECLVCCENIRPFQSAWSCTNCYHIIHFNCIVKWATSSKSDEGWRCPACQNITVKVPQHCYCFCGKQRDPPYNRNDVAHTCGELCGRIDGCTHPCTLLCHPGPCPPCQATVTRKCGCERTERTMQCCQQEELHCAATCDKYLLCGVHQCTKTCHTDPCDECTEKLDHKCHCGKDKREVSCTAENNEQLRYSCNKLCNRMLSCKNHKCKDICHSGDCARCRLSADLVTSCPCGKIPIHANDRKSCSDPVPLCGNVCGKPLKCGAPSNPHQCTNKCHTGNCAPCNKETAVKCRCGHMDQMIKCKQLSTRADDARCKKRCVRKRNCGKHKCNQECCIDIDHVCPMPCNHNLSCGKHKCDQTCHKGRCPPCYRSSFDELFCECGANVIYPPVACGTKRPACDRPCSRAHPCDHPVQHNCHSATACPPCMAFTTKYCHGKHEQRKTIPCSQADFSCGLPCNKQLRCGQHKCQKPCHGGECEKDGELCKQLCPKPRIMCSHNCNAVCHTGDCPDIPCRESVEVLCQCGHRKQQRKCHDFAKEYQRIASMKFASTMEDMQRGTMVELSDVLGPVKLAGNNKTLECNDECKLIERNRRIDLAFKNTEPSTKIQTKYSDFIKGWARKDAKLVQMIHDNLTDLVRQAKDSRNRSHSFSFPTMNREKRQLVHEMCEMFGVESIASIDAEPNRNVVGIAKKETSWFPSMSIFEVLQRESGQRRIPVPSNNAWGIKR